MKVSVLSNINVNSIVSIISKKFEVYTPDGYNIWIQELINVDSNLNKFSPEILFIIIDGTELISNLYEENEIKSEIDVYFDYIRGFISLNSSTKCFVSNIDIINSYIKLVDRNNTASFIESYWNSKLLSIGKNYKNIFLLDLKSIVDIYGRKMIYSNKLWYLASIRYSSKGEKIIVGELNRLIDICNKPRKKCVVLDLDNTLWGGVIGEAGIDGIELSNNKSGARYRDFQKVLMEMKKMGVMLAICSKNNYEDAIEAINNHPDMILREGDFVSIKINWDIKSENIIKISNELNIGLDSMVFIDDSPNERELVKSAIQDIIVPDFPDDTIDLCDFIIDIYKKYFYKLNFSDEDLIKTNLYLQNRRRDEEKNCYKSYEDFLKELKTKIYIWEAKQEDLNRVYDLISKTNQFNLTTIRYTEQELSDFIESNNYLVYVGAVEDKFGYSGKVCVAIIELKDNIAIVNTFLMSCRVMGRQIENQFIGYIEESLKLKGIKTIYTLYKKTKKNKPVEMLYENLGYILTETLDSTKKYELDISGIIPERIKFAEVIEK